MVTIQGTILSIMETWPLQLVVQQGSHRHNVTLAENVEVKRGGRAADVSALRPGIQATIFADRRQGGALVAHGVTIAG